MRRIRQVFLHSLLTILLSVCGFCGFSLGDVLVTDNFGNQVLRFDSATGSFRGIFISDNAELNGGLEGPIGMVETPTGDLLVASRDTNSILRYNGLTGEFLGVFADSGMAGPSRLAYHPVTGNLLVGNFFGNSVSEFDHDGNFLGAFTDGGNLAGVSAFAFDADSNLYVGSFQLGRVERYDSSGNFIDTFWANDAVGTSGLWFQGDQLWVSTLFEHEVHRLNPDGSVDLNFSTNADGIPTQDGGTFPGFITASPFGSDEVLIGLTASGGFYRFGEDGGLRGGFANFAGVPGEMIFAPIPEPTMLLPLSLVAAGWILRRRKISC